MQNNILSMRCLITSNRYHSVVFLERFLVVSQSSLSPDIFCVVFQKHTFYYRIKFFVQNMDQISVDVAFLTYNPERDIHQPVIKLDSTCHAGVSELEEHYKLKRKEKFVMGTAAYNHYKWYNSCLMLECQKLDDSVLTDNKTQLKIRHWNIESGNIEAFTMEGVAYKAVSMIISPTVEYWYCSNQDPNAAQTFGSRSRSSGNSENDCGKINIRNVRFETDVDKIKCVKTPKGSKSPITRVKNTLIFVNNKQLEQENKSSSQCSSVLKAIEVLNQKKSILRHGSPNLLDCQKIKNGLKSIFEDRKC